MPNTNSRTHSVLAALLLCTAFAARAETLHYGPEVVTLHGTLEKKTFYGAPGFGEDPKHDAVEPRYILKLDAPVDVVATAAQQKEGIEVAEMAITEITVNEADLDAQVGKHAQFRGMLSHAINGHHHTKILLDPIKTGK